MKTIFHRQIKIKKENKKYEKETNIKRKQNGSEDP